MVPKLNPKDPKHFFEEPGPDIIIRRSMDGIVQLNIPRRAVLRNSTGYEIGFSGQGQVELALNIMVHFLPGKEVRCPQGTCSMRAWDLHRDFDKVFLSSISPEGGRISRRKIWDWIESALSMIEKREGLRAFRKA